MRYLGYHHKKRAKSSASGYYSNDKMVENMTSKTEEEEKPEHGHSVINMLTQTSTTTTERSDSVIHRNHSTPPPDSLPVKPPQPTTDTLMLSPNGNTVLQHPITTTNSTNMFDRPLVSPIMASASPPVSAVNVILPRPLISPTPASLPSPAPSDASSTSNTSSELIPSTNPSPESPDTMRNEMAPSPTATSTPLSSHPVPVKRRPGRPPGSTKKPRPGCPTGEYRKRDGRNDEFSLRRFYELGGRDYNEYLEWLKKHQARHDQQNTQPPQQRHPPPSYMSPTLPSYTKLISTPSVAASPRQVALPGMPQRPLYLPRTPEGALPAGYRPLIMPQVGVTAAGVRAFPAAEFVPMTGGPIQFGVLPGPANMPTGLSRQGNPASAAPLSPKEATESVLDLSTAGKKRKSDPTEHQFSVRKLMKPATQSPVSTVCLNYNVNNNITSVKNTDSEGDHQMAPPPKMDINGNHTSSSPGVCVGSTSDLMNLATWDIDHVVKFVTSVPGCQEYAEVFREHRIDGATLPHLSEDHLLKQLSMKLGPAIRLRLEISKLTTKE